MTAGSLREVHPPRHPIYRVARRQHEPFEPKPWSLAGSDGTFGDRFDDPGGVDDPCGQRVIVPEGSRFRVIYCATTPAGAFGETIARVRPKRAEIPGLMNVEDDPAHPEAGDAYLRGLRDPEDPTRGVLLANWRLERQLYRTTLDPSLVVVDLAAPETVSCLREELAPLAVASGLDDVDLSTVTGPMPRFTQECARDIYERCDERGRPLFAGIRYLSRLNLAWECWAIFSDRMLHRSDMPQTNFPDNPELLEVAAPFNLSVEVLQGSARYLRP